MSKLKRQIQRKATKDAKKELQAKIGLFDKLEDSCLVCEKEFDKTNKEMVSSWCVVVRKETGIVNLYCPECWGRATTLVEELQEGLNGRSKK